jgi:hypothetical protein
VINVVRGVVILMLSLLILSPVAASANSLPSQLENVMSETLDLWREGRHEELYGRLAKRGKTSREQFVRTMSDSTIKPACCWQKMENFKLLNGKKNSATVYVKIGLDGMPGQAQSITREFRLLNEHGTWKMQLSDITALAGGVKRKQKKHYRAGSHYK